MAIKADVQRNRSEKDVLNRISLRRSKKRVAQVEKFDFCKKNCLRRGAKGQSRDALLVRY